MDTKDDMIEELEDVNEEIKPDKKIEEIENEIPIIEDASLEDSSANLNNEKSETDINSDINLDDKKEDIGSEADYETVDKKIEPEKKKSKAPLIILLSILLVIDIAALAAYIIGIDKVISFIK